MQLVPDNFVWVSNIQVEDLANIQRQDPSYPGVLGDPGATHKYSQAELAKMGIRGLYLPANNRRIPQRTSHLAT